MGRHSWFSFFTCPINESRGPSAASRCISHVPDSSPECNKEISIFHERLTLSDEIGASSGIRRHDREDEANNFFSFRV
jgi:hypothetical protein